MSSALPSLSSKFSFRTSEGGVPVLCLGTEQWPAAPAPVASPVGGAGGDAAKGRVQERLTKASGPRHAAAEGVKIGGPFTKSALPSFLGERASVYDRVIAAQHARLAGTNELAPCLCTRHNIV